VSALFPDGVLVHRVAICSRSRDPSHPDFGAVPEHDVRVELWQRSGCWSVVTLHPRKNRAGELDWYVVGQPAHHLGLPESLLAERMAIGSALGHVEGVLGARACAARAIHEERSARR